jgi:cytochrome c-type biogenesis protein CcmH
MNHGPFAILLLFAKVAIRGRCLNLPGAAEAWHKALDGRFDPMLAAQTAEAMTRVNGQVNSESAALFRRALAEAPADAPWRSIVERRLAEVKTQ